MWLRIVRAAKVQNLASEGRIVWSWGNDGLTSEGNLFALGDGILESLFALEVGIAISCDDVLLC